MPYQEVVMCLAIPVRVVEIDASGDAGKVDYLGTKIGANFALIRDVDWRLGHRSCRIRHLPPG